MTVNVFDEKLNGRSTAENQISLCLHFQKQWKLPEHYQSLPCRRMSVPPELLSWPIGKLLFAHSPKISVAIRLNLRSVLK